MEGNDALFTCKVRHKSPPPKWLKDNKEIVQNENYKTLHEYTEYKLRLKNVQLSNNGEYCVEVGKYSRKLKLNIKSNDFLRNLNFKQMSFCFIRICHRMIILLYMARQPIHI